MNSSERWTQFYNVLGLASLPRRADILRRQFLNHRFDRRSPIPALPDLTLNRIYDYEVVLPPRRFLMQPGVQTIDGILFLVSLALSLRVRSVFEIGTYTGLTTWALARNLPEASVDTLDIPEDATPCWKLDIDDVHRAAADNLLYERLPGGSGISQHWQDSALFDFAPYHGQVDLVYIDGAHSEEYVRSDTTHAMEMISSAGAIVWDDYWRLSPGVVTVLHQLSPKLHLLRVPGTRLVVHFGKKSEQEERL